jgi:DNA-binding NtrC family response regulator
VTKGKNILVVDDEESVAFFLSENLSALTPAYSVKTAYSGEEALDKVAIEAFDLVVTDLRMPGLSGLELIQKVRAMQPKTQAILITAYGNEDIKSAAHHIGACCYITKPFKMEQFTHMVYAILQAKA